MDDGSRGAKRRLLRQEKREREVSDSCCRQEKRIQTRENRRRNKEETTEWIRERVQIRCSRTLLPLSAGE